MAKKLTQTEEKRLEALLLKKNGPATTSTETGQLAVQAVAGGVTAEDLEKATSAAVAVAAEETFFKKMTEARKAFEDVINDTSSISQITVSKETVVAELQEAVKILVEDPAPKHMAMVASFMIKLEQYHLTTPDNKLFAAAKLEQSTTNSIPLMDIVISKRSLQTDIESVLKAGEGTLPSFEHMSPMEEEERIMFGAEEAAADDLDTH